MTRTPAGSEWWRREPRPVLSGAAVAVQSDDGQAVTFRYPREVGSYVAQLS